MIGMTEQENRALYIAEQCRKAGLTLAGASGVLANVEAESAFNPHNLQDSYETALGYQDESYTAAVDNGVYQNFTRDAAGYGLAQWTAADRKAKMLAYFKQRGVSIGDFRTQVDFLLYEMRSYSKAWNTVTTTANAYMCGYAVCKYYEIPANTEAQAQSRGRRAEEWYNWLAQHMDEQSTITDEPREKPKTDEDGIVIPKTWPPRTIDSHCSGWPEVKLLQAALLCRGYSVLIDGIFGEALQEKVLAFQRKAGLAPDGIVGEATWTVVLKF